MASPRPVRRCPPCGFTSQEARFTPSSASSSTRRSPPRVRGTSPSRDLASATASGSGRSGMVRKGSFGAPILLRPSGETPGKERKGGAREQPTLVRDSSRKRLLDEFIDAAEKSGSTRLPPEEPRSDSHMSPRLKSRDCLTSRSFDESPRRDSKDKEGVTAGSPSRHVSGRRQSLLGGAATRAKMGGKLVAVNYPKDIYATVKAMPEEKIRQLCAPPKENIVCEYVHGYNSTCRRNLFTVKGVRRREDGSYGVSYLYNAATLGVVLDLEDNTQELFTGHSTEITAIAYSEVSRLCATGQRLVGREAPHICVWSVDDRVERLRLLGHLRSVDALEFSADSRWLFSTGSIDMQRHAESLTRKSSTRTLHRGGSQKLFDDSLTAGPKKGDGIFVWAIEASAITSAGVQTVSAPSIIVSAIIDNVYGLVPHPFNPEKFICCGQTSISFVSCCWAACHRGMEPDTNVHRPSYGNRTHEEPAVGFTVASHVPASDLVLAGTEGGMLFVYHHVGDGVVCLCDSKILAGTALHVIEWTSSGLLITGGADCGICVLAFKPNGQIELLLRCPLRAPGGTPLVPNALLVREDLDGGLHFIVGTTSCEIVELEADRVGAEAVLLQKAPMHEVWAVATHPLVPSKFVVADALGHLWLYDAVDRTPCQALPYVCQAGVKCLDWDPQGQLLACGLDNGRLEVVATFGWTEDDKSPSMKFLLITSVLPQSAFGESNSITSICFSPAADGGDWLACGGRDGRVALYAVLRSESVNGGCASAHLMKHRVFSLNSSGVLSLQFSNDGNQVCSNSKDGQLLGWEVNTGEKTAFGEGSWSEKGHPFRLTMSWQTLGIWNSDKYDYTAAIVATSDWDAKLLAVGDCFGLVKLHSFPSPIACAASHEHVAHSSRVTGLAWTQDGRLVSAGAGRGDAVIQWRVPGRVPSTPPRIRTIGDNATQEPLGGVEAQQAPEESPRAPELPLKPDKAMQTDSESLVQWAPELPLKRDKPMQTDSGSPVPHLMIKSVADNVCPSPPAATVWRQVASTPRGQTTVGSLGTGYGSQGSPRSTASALLSSRLQVSARSTSSLASVDWDTLVNVRRDRSSSPPPSVMSSAFPAQVLRTSSSSSSTSMLQAAPVQVLRNYSSSTSTSVAAPPPRVSPQLPSTISAFQMPGSMPATVGIGTCQSPTSSTRSIATVVGTGTYSTQSTASPVGTGRGVVTSRIIAPPTSLPASDLSVRVSEIKSGRKISSAALYLYHPPFALDVAVDYVRTEQDGVVELFSPPRGWGVLRSGAGLLLWIRLESNGAAWQAVAEDAEALRFEFQAAGGASASVDAIVVAALSGTRKALHLGEGLLHPDIGRALHVRFAAHFDGIVKQWLSVKTHCGLPGSMERPL